MILIVCIKNKLSMNKIADMEGIIMKLSKKGNFIISTILTFVLLLSFVVVNQSSAKAVIKANKIILNNARLSLYVGEKKTIKVKKVIPKKAGKNIKYKSENKSVATVSRKGVVTAVGIGKARITVAAKINKKVRKTVKVTVTDKTEEQMPENNNELVKMNEPYVSKAPIQTKEPTKRPTKTPTKEPTDKPTATPNHKITPTPNKAPANTPDKVVIPEIKYQAHIQIDNWGNIVSDGDSAGTIGKSKRLEALKIFLEDSNGESQIKYQTHIQSTGWQDWKASGEISGTTGKALAIEAVRIKLSDTYANKYDVYYRVYVEEYGWLGWAKNGEMAGSTGIALRTEAIQIRLVQKNSIFNTIGSASLTKPELSYQAYCQNDRWKELVKENTITGTIGKSLRLEALKINLKDFWGNNGVLYNAHVSNIGWQGWKNSGEMAGTIEQAKAIEAVQIKLSTSLERIFDIYYRVHVAKYGWLGWAKNGEYAGTTGGGIRAEAIQIKLVNKGEKIDVGGEAYKKITATSNFAPRTTAPSTSDARYYASNPFYQMGYAMPNCTAYAYGRAWEIIGSKPLLSTGAAGVWYSYNKSKGCYSYGNTPKLGAVMCWSNHVAIVEAISGNLITISESNYAGRIFNVRVIDASNPNGDMSGGIFQGYIYIR